MASTAAERQRRYRRHSKGDHTLCDPARCHGDAPRVTSHPSLGIRGAQLWRELSAEDQQPGIRVLIEEACRLADRLDVLDRILRGDQSTWLDMVPVGLDGTVVRIEVRPVLSEARQQQVALKQLVSEIRQAGGLKEQKREASIGDELAALRLNRERRTQAQ